MCWWGAALVLGPHVNAGMDPANNPKAWDRLQRAQRAASGVTEKEQVLHQGAGHTLRGESTGEPSAAR